ncbi:hypothetical protein E2C01_073600 [Portunus trituberculatus]|uniref:Uncharacterized protein n=1 Tax=Portunus trituberculatus TaxID=210409 RepID=A0A5B7IDX8_PORTR|nr:hypothetical protein [Portunus trituberculatus]
MPRYFILFCLLCYVSPSTCVQGKVPSANFDSTFGLIIVFLNVLAAYLDRDFCHNASIRYSFLPALVCFSLLLGTERSEDC